MAVDNQMTAARLEAAKNHVYNVTQLGSNITLIKSATKDELGGILTKDTITIKAFPIRFSPYDRKVEKNISFAYDTDILAYVSKKKIDDLSLTAENIRRNLKLRYAGKTYDIRYCEPYNFFANDFLYYVLGGKI